jgi:pimeloyl-ACP methyl ester carboxylesterase
VTLEHVTSADGTPIAFERTGSGPAVVLIGGAFNDRSTVSGLAATLAPHATAVCYDRRGRGASGASGDYDPKREIEDLAAVAGAVGGSAAVFGHSSGAVIAALAAARGLPVQKLALYEPTYVVDDSRPRPGADLPGRVQALLADGNAGDAAALFLTEAVALPPEMVQGMRASGAWAFFTALAPSLPFDLAVCGPGMELPEQQLASITVPTLVLNGSNTAPWLAAASRAVAGAIPGAGHRVIEGQDHGILQHPEALRDVLTDFLG